MGGQVLVTGVFPVCPKRSPAESGTSTATNRNPAYTAKQYGRDDFPWGRQGSKDVLIEMHLKNFFRLASVFFSLLEIAFDFFQKKYVGIVAVAYLVGFVSWNYLLSRFGFFEYNLLATRFLSAGIAFSLVAFFIFVLMFFIGIVLTKFNFLKIDQTLTFQLRGTILATMLFIPIFILFIFPVLPVYLGGGKPFSVSIIGSAEQMSYLTNFNIELEENAGKSKVQTKLLCQIYQNAEFTIFIIANKEDGGEGGITVRTRAMALKAEEVKGFSRALVADRENTCDLAKLVGWF